MTPEAHIPQESGMEMPSNPMETPKASANFGDLSRDLNRNSLNPNSKRAILGGLSGTVAAGALAFSSVNAQENPVTPEDCVSPSPSASMTLESPMPSASPFVENPDGSIDVFVPSPSPVASAEPSAFPSPIDAANLPNEPLVQGEETVVDPENCDPANSEDLVFNSVDEIWDGVVDGDGEGEAKRINKKQFSRIVKGTSDDTARWFDESGAIPGDTAKDELTYYMSRFNEYTEMNEFKVSGRTLAENIVNLVSLSQDAEKAGDLDAAKAFIELATAFYRVGITYIKFDKSSDQFDKAINKAAKEKEIS